MSQAPRPGRMRPTVRRPALLLAVVALVAGCGAAPSLSSPSLSSPSLSSPSSWSPALAPDPHAPAPGGLAAGGSIARPPGPLGEADGAVPAGTSVFDDSVPGVANLDPALLAALRRAASDAPAGVRFSVHSGWRSVAYQEQLFRTAVATHGSERAAARWVARPATSAHVSGEAVDLGPSAATRWLAAHGAAYGLCGVYRNEPWHFELRPDAPAHGCPARYADAAADPRSHA